MPMTDAPNFETKFGRRKPCLRYIGPPLDPTSVAPVGRGDFTLPNPPCSAPCRGRAPSRPTRPLFPANPRWFPNASPPRVGADLCVRPDTPFYGTRTRADTQVGPYRFYCSLHQPPKTGRGQSPAPTVDECPMPVRDLPGHRQPRLPQAKMPGMTAGIKASIFRPPSQRPSYRNPP